MTQAAVAVHDRGGRAFLKNPHLRLGVNLVVCEETHVGRHLPSAVTEDSSQIRQHEQVSHRLCISKPHTRSLEDAAYKTSEICDIDSNELFRRGVHGTTSIDEGTSRRT